MDRPSGRRDIRIKKVSRGRADEEIFRNAWRHNYYYRGHPLMVDHITNLIVEGSKAKGKLQKAEDVEMNLGRSFRWMSSKERKIL